MKYFCCVCPYEYFLLCMSVKNHCSDTHEKSTEKMGESSIQRKFVREFVYISIKDRFFKIITEKFKQDSHDINVLFVVEKYPTIDTFVITLIMLNLDLYLYVF